MLTFRFPLRDTTTVRCCARTLKEINVKNERKARASRSFTCRSLSGSEINCWLEKQLILLLDPQKPLILSSCPARTNTITTLCSDQLEMSRVLSLHTHTVPQLRDRYGVKHLVRILPRQSLRWTVENTVSPHNLLHRDTVRTNEC